MIVSEATASRVLTTSAPQDAQFLLILICMLASSEFSSSSLSHGALPRKRWTEQGQVGDMACAGLAPQLEKPLSNPLRLRSAIGELERALVITRTYEDRYILDEATRGRILSTLPPRASQVWREQAFNFTCHAVFWKHLEPVYDPKMPGKMK